ncbi:hypothetical protein OG738_13530 [Amycolatopsis sp. NBC_01488]|uniref:hypothetical protein n=1 Tax=Amycolatopsis sp. NBC_01488 TaxID=2903563 RepID=UPI002E2971D5|nr:hypothetical protein [Amycolatopsis sp. NBC_01488]
MRITTAPTVGKVNGKHVKFTPVHREDNPSRVAATMTVALPLSIEDIAAVLMYITNGCSRAEVTDWLADPGEVRRLVMETAWALGGSAINDERLGLAEIESGTWDSERLDMVWTCSVQVFTPGTKVPAPRRSLERVA